MEEYEEISMVGMIKKGILDQMLESYINGKWDEVEKIRNIYQKDEDIQSFFMKLCIYDGRFEEAKNIGRQFMESEKVQYKMITIYQLEEDYSKARSIGEMFPNSALIQSKMINIALRENIINKARGIGERECFKESYKIQAQLLHVYSLDRNYEGINDILNRFTEGKEKRGIRASYVKMLLQQGNYKEAEKVCEQYTNDEMFESLLINVKIRQKDYETAKRLGLQFLDNPSVQSQMLKIAVEENDDETVDKIGKRFPNYYIIQSQMIKIAMRHGRTREAKERAKKFKNIATIQSQMLFIAMQEKDEKTIKEIEIRFHESPIIQAQVVKYYCNIDRVDLAEEISKRFYDNQEMKKTLISARCKKNANSKRRKNFLRKQKTYIYEDMVNENLVKEIEQSCDISNWERMLVLLAIDEKADNMIDMKRRIDEYKKENPDLSKQRQKIINEVYKRTKSKARRIFDWRIYDENLEWELDEKLITELEKAKQEKTSMDSTRKKFLESIKYSERLDEQVTDKEKGDRFQKYREEKIV